MDRKREKFDLGQFIEDNKFIIGGVLLCLVIAGTAFLLWRENYWKPEQESRMANYELSLTEQESKIKELQEKLDNSKTVQTDSQPAASSEGQGSNQGQPLSSEGQVTSNQVAPLRQGYAGQVNSEGGQVKGASTQSITPTIGKININTATAAQLDSLPGIGPVYAQRIIDYRVAHRGFKSIEEVKNVKGIGDATFNKFKDKITI